MASCALVVSMNGWTQFLYFCRVIRAGAISDDVPGSTPGDSSEEPMHKGPRKGKSKGVLARQLRHDYSALELRSELRTPLPRHRKRSEVKSPNH